MKKNRTMRVAALLLALTLMTSCFVGGTFAKYTSSDNGSDMARVAKWGVEVAIDATMFADAYKDEAVTWTENETSTDITVQADTKNTKVVAPGTEGDLAGFTVTGTPEVDVEVVYTAELTLENWEINGDEYCPIIFTVNSVDYYIGMNTVTVGGTDYTPTDIAGLIEVVEAAIVASYAYYHTNTDLSAVNDDLTISWRWEYVKSTVDFQDDDLDTKLGNQAASGTDGIEAATIKLEVSMTITQVN